MNILITGSSGYIGSNFVDTFRDKYNFLRFSLLQESMDNLQINKVDIVLHCAALVHQKVAYDYETYYDVNVEYPIALAKKAKENGVKQFIFISTIAVYGGSIELIEEDTECDPVTLYGKSKLEAERQLEELSGKNFVVSIIRPPMVYGKDAPGNIHSLTHLITKVPLLPFADILNNRSFIYIGNLVYIINTIILKNRSGIFLATDDKAISTTYLIEHIANALGKKIYLVKVPFFETVLRLIKPSLHQRLFGSLEVDGSRTRKVLQLKNPYSVEEGIKYTIQGE